MAEGTITRKDIIEDDALAWGADYAKMMDAAIGKNKEFTNGILAMHEANIKLRESGGQKEYVDNQKRVNEESSKTLGIWKEQNQLELALISTKKKNMLATEATNRALAKERTLLAETNKEIKLETRGQLGLISAYEKLSRSRLEAQKRLANLLAAEKQNNVEIKIAQREFDKLDSRIKAVDASTKTYYKNIGNYKSAFTGLAGSLRGLVSAFGLVTGVALFGQVVRDVFNTIKDFDRQLIAVGKTTNITGADLKKFGADVVALGDSLDGISIEGLLLSAEVAGQLGVKGTENILKFSTAIEKLKLTSDIISQEQVQDFAKFIEVSKDSFENADKLASVITQLGNNFATTEAQILSNATEIQKGVSIYEASAESILGLGAATSALGSEAETSRSAVMTAFKVIDNAISTGKNLEKVLKLTNLTQKQLSDQFNKDATGVFVKFVGGLKKAKEEGGNLNNILDSVQITEKRAVTVIGALSANYDVLKNSVMTATLEYQENLALNKEVAAAAESVSSILGDVKDKWDAYILSTDQANGGTQKIANALKYLRDNLSKIIDNFIKYGSVLLAYFGIMKLINFITISYTALKTAAAAAELSFAIATGIGRASVLAQAEAVKAATIAQNGLNVAMKATPWGLILALVGAAIVAYKMFNDELSQAEKTQAKIKINNDNQKAQDDSYANDRDANRAKSFKDIEYDIELQKKSGGDKKKLDQEEINRKKEVIQAQLDVFNNLKQTEIERTRIAIQSSEQRIAQMQLEKKAMIADIEKGYGRKLRPGETDNMKSTFDIAGESENLKMLKASLQNNSVLTLAEQRKLNQAMADLDKDKKLKDAETLQAETEEANKKFLAAQKKLRKELYENQKKANDDAFKLSQFRLQREIDINEEIVKDEKSSIDDKLDAIDVSNRLMLQKSKEGLENDLKQLGEYNEDTGKFIRELSDIEIAQYIKTGELKKELTSEQKLLYEKYQETLTEIATKEEKKRQAVIDSELAVIQKRIDAELQTQENSANQDLTKENDIYKNELDAAKGNFELIEKARIDHEKRILAIQKEYALNGLNTQISAIEQLLANQAKLPESERISAEKIAKYTADLFRFKKEVSDLETENYAGNIYTKEQLEKEFNDRVKDLAFQIKDALVDFTNTIFDAKIQRIDEDIQKSEDYYNKQLELAGDDQIQKDLITNAAEKEREKLEDKKRKEQRKQAIFNKIITIGTIAAQTAMASIAALAPPPVGLGPVFGTALLPYIIGFGAVQAATVLAQPIPKYKTGRKKGKAEIAQVGDGGVSEVVTDKFGNNPWLTPNTPTLTFLNEDDVVHSSVDEYNRIRKATMSLSIANEGRKINDFQARQLFNDAYNKEVIEELKQTRRAIQSQKTVILKNKIDIPYAMWKFKNTNW